MITLKIAKRNIFRHKTRSIITLSAIAFGCVAIIFVGGFFDDIFYKMRESYIMAHTGHIQVFKNGFFEKGTAKPFDYLIDNPQGITSLINKVKGIRFITSRLEFSGLISTGENTISFVGQGIEPKNERSIFSGEVKNLKEATKNLILGGGTIIEQGNPLEPDDTYKVILGKGLASGIEAKPQDNIVLLTNTVNGSINALDVSVKGIFFSSSKGFDDHFLRLPLTTAQKLLHTESVQSLIILLNKTQDTMIVKKELQSLFQQNKLDLEIKTWDELNDFYVKTVQLFNKFFLIIKLVVAIIVILSIFNTMNMAVLERISEIGTIMALGTKRRNVLKLFIYEGAILGIFGGIIGIISGALITTLVSYIGITMPPPPGASMYWLSEPKVVPSVLLFSFILSVITSVISSLYPAYKASRLEIANALRYR